MQFFNNDIQKTILLSRKGVYPHECMDGWENFNETSLPEKDKFYSNINMKDIINADYMHAKTVCKDFEIKHLGEYRDLFFKSDTLLLARKIYALDPSKLLSAPGLVWHTALKKS